MLIEVFNELDNVLSLLWQDANVHLLSPNKRLYWGYLVSTFVLVFLVYRTEYKKTGVWNWRKSFGREVLFHPSSILDSKIWFINLLIKAWIITPLLFAVAPVAIATHKTLTAVFGEITIVAPEWVVLTSFTAFLFVLDDLTRFLLHALMHKVPFLWRFHRLHHSAEVMTPLTVYRTHPIESFLYASRLLLVNAITIGLGVYLFKSKLSFYDIAGANVAVFIFNLLGANLRHSQVWLCWNKRIEKWFISPAQHQIHHSQATPHIDKNFGTALAIWDRMAGTLITSNTTTQDLTFGVKGTKLRSVMQAYLSPLKKGL